MGDPLNNYVQKVLFTRIFFNLTLLIYLLFFFLHSPLPSPPPLKRAKPDSKAWIEQHDCVLCGGNDHPNTILICDKCDEGSHLKCLWLEDVPDTKYWFCDFCTSLK